MMTNYTEFEQIGHVMWVMLLARGCQTKVMGTKIFIYF